VKMAEKTGGGILAISEGVFGMRGEQGRLKEIVALKKKYNFRLLVDDAHGFGTLGEGGRGTGYEQGVQDDIDVYFATFAKSMAGIGAFLAGDKDVIQFLQYNMRSQTFAKTLPMAMVKGALKDTLWKNTNSLQSGLRNAGFDLGTTQTCITPVFLQGEVPEAMALVYDLRENHGVFCSIVVYPVIPKGLIILRLIPTATHTQTDIDETIVAFSAIRDLLENGTYKKLAASMMEE
jgi:glycine C-acetyltransferase